MTSLRAESSINSRLTTSLKPRCVSWLLARVFLRFMATKASALCGLCPLHHAVGVVHVPSLRR